MKEVSDSTVDGLARHLLAFHDVWFRGHEGWRFLFIMLPDKRKSYCTVEPKQSAPIKNIQKREFSGVKHGRSRGE